MFRLITIISLISTHALYSQNSKNKSYKDNKLSLTTGVLFSKHHSNSPSFNQYAIYRNNFFLDLSYNRKIYKAFNIKSSISYHRRTPLETLIFPKGNNIGANDFLVLGDWPTNKQNKNYNINLEATTPLSPFQYLNFDLIPIFSIGRHLNFDLGLGPYGSFLINKKQTLITIDKFSPAIQELIKSRNVIKDYIEYTYVDAGLAYYLNINYPISKISRIGLSGKYFHSYRRLNNTAIKYGSFWRQNLFWRVFTTGVSWEYSF